MNEEENGIYYFLGNTTSHILHALPLHRKLGGTFVVLSEKARQKIENLYDVPVIALDNIPYQWHRYGYKIKPVHEYDHITKKHRKTVDFLNQNARVVLFYDLFDFDPAVRISKPKTVFLTHGNMLKDYMGENNRVQKMEQYDYMSALGPVLKKQFIKKGIPESKLVDLGVARTDDVVRHQGQVVISPELQALLNDTQKPIVSYLPTFWGASSIYTTGLELLHHIPDDYTVLFRPHPATPQKLLRRYRAVIKKRRNIYYLPEGAYRNISLVDIFDASSLVIGDVSSVMLEAILIRKPLVFAYGDGEHSQNGREYTSITDVVKRSGRIDSTNIEVISTVINRSISGSVDEHIWDTTTIQNFYHADGTSVQAIKDFIETL